MAEIRVAIATDIPFKLTLNRQPGQTYNLGDSIIKVAVAEHPEGEAIACFSTQNNTIIKDATASSELKFVGNFILPAALSTDFVGITYLYLFPRIFPEGGLELSDFNSLQRIVLIPAPRC